MKIDTVTEGPAIYGKLMGSYSYVPLAQQVRRQTASAVHHHRYVVLANQWVTTSPPE